MKRDSLQSNKVANAAHFTNYRSILTFEEVCALLAQSAQDAPMRMIKIGWTKQKTTTWRLRIILHAETTFDQPAHHAITDSRS